MKFTKEGVDQSVDKLYTPSGYDVTIKLYQHHVIERHNYACRGHVPDAINVLGVFCSFYTVISAVSQT